MAKNIIICCDGTSNDFGERPSNVVHLFTALDKNPEKQIVYYDPGVGTPSTYDAFNPITKKLKYILGQAFGYGLSSNIMEAYKFLMEYYEEGDRLFFFGFSRGAYTVRALAGFIDVCGLLHANCGNLIPEAMRIYWNPKFSKYPKDSKGKPLDDSISRKFKKTFSRTIKIHFLGLWDTVSSVGWVWDPITLQSTKNNKSVINVRHAISIDERRAFFRQNTWGKPKKEIQDVKQVWFAGVHSDVGGSYAPEKSGLSNIALEWMLVEARKKGAHINLDKAKELIRLKINDQAIDDLHLQPLNKSLSGMWHIAELWPKLIKRNLTAKKQREARKKNTTVPKDKWVSRVYFNRWRYRYIPPFETHTLHESVLLRMQNLETYRPKNVMGICDEIPKIKEKFQIEKWVRLQ